MRFPRARTLLGVALIGLGVAAYILPAPRRPQPLRVPDARTFDGPRLLPDVGGAIQLVACNANSARRATLRNAGLINAIVNALPSPTRFLLLSSDPQAFRVTSDPIPD